MADRRKLSQGLMMMTPSARADIAQQADEFERFKQADYLRKMGEQGAGLAKSVARGVPQMATGLVDLASMPFEAAGVLQPGQAVGSTKWLESRGYLPESQPGFANQLTELLSGGFDPSDLVTKGLPALGMIGKTVWHGSPHIYDKFDLSKIGTGEGAQAYGHGLYLAESPDVAGSYRTAGDMGWFEREADKALYSQDIDNAIASTKKELERVSKEPRYVDAKNNLTGVLNVLEARKAGANEYGYLYKVDLPDEQIAKMLDYEKPFSQQSEYVQNALMNAPFEVRAGGDYSGSDLYDMAQSYAASKVGEKNPAGGSALLNELGIPGIQYLDQASRGAGEGTRNYVVFSDEIPQILERNGQPIAQALRDYRGSHTAPGPEFGAQLHDVTGGGQMYPEDIYSSRGASIYGHGGSDVGMDKETMRIIHQMRNKPEEMVDIYRAVPNEGNITSINAGDWVTINPNYAKQHGESNLPEGYKILQQKVPAKSVWTNADSIHEFGYWPE